MKQNVVIILVVFLFLSFFGLLAFGAYLNKNQIDVQTVIKKITEKISGVEDNISQIKGKLDENNRQTLENNKKVDDLFEYYSKDVKNLKSGIRANAELIKREKSEINQNYKKLSNMLKNTQNIMYRLDNSVDALFKNQKVFASYKSKFEKVNVDIQDIYLRLQLLEQKKESPSDISAFKGEIDGKLSEMNDKIALFNNENITKIGDIESKVNDVYSKLDSFKTTAPVDKTSDVTAEKYQNDFNEINAKIENLFTAIEAKNSGIIEEYNKLKEQIMAMEQKIENSEVNKSDLTADNGDKAVNDIKNNLENFQSDINSQIISFKETIEQIDKKLIDLENKYGEIEKKNLKTE
ncbi:MAG TPA: hypothetical protein PLO89_00520 [Spirochaetota bacterium]|nr:hypothetical protein [Spirochaetota bacterium]